MAQWERDHLTESDPHGLLFGPDEDELHGTPQPAPMTRSAQRRSQREHAHRRRRRRNGRLMTILALLIVVIIGGGGYVYIKNVIEVKDYSGSGSGKVTVTVNSGDTASTIAATLKKAGVVRSEKAFTNAANDNPESQNIQAGTYTLHRRMSAKNALAMLLDPASRNSESDVVVTEGATTLDVAARLAKALGTSPATVRRVIDNVQQFGLPSTYSADSGAPPSLEGFLYPATYPIDPGSKAEQAINQMINKFIEQDRASGFAANAKARKLSPYRALIIASIAQSEAKFASDLPKVVRVIMNRIAAGQPLQIDATSVYGAKVMGLDPRKVVYSKLDSPYNTYTHSGLTPTPISNPGADAMNAAVNPASGTWMYYVNGDAQGHLFFTSSEAEFTRAVERCRTNNWGCG